MNIINLTPHDVTILNENKEAVLVVPRSMQVARLDSDRIAVDALLPGVPFWNTKYGIPYLARIDEKGIELERLQFPTEDEDGDTIYIVSGIFRAGYPRPDLWQPGELVRDDKGQPVGCVGLSQ